MAPNGMEKKMHLVMLKRGRLLCGLHIAFRQIPHYDTCAQTYIIAVVESRFTQELFLSAIFELLYVYFMIIYRAIVASY